MVCTYPERFCRLIFRHTVSISFPIGVKGPNSSCFRIAGDGQPWYPHLTSPMAIPPKWSPKMAPVPQWVTTVPSHEFEPHVKQAVSKASPFLILDWGGCPMKVELIITQQVWWVPNMSNHLAFFCDRCVPIPNLKLCALRAIEPVAGWSLNPKLMVGIPETWS